MTRADAMPIVWTVGYAQASLAAVLADLTSVGIELLVDVRAVAASRRAGFSKTVLRTSLEAAGIGYLHLRGLGTPKPGRDAARRGRVAEMRAIYAAHLETPAAMTDWWRLCDLVPERRSALLCYCASAAGCHRRVITERLEMALGVVVVDL
ncbi:MAG: DUF488 family protein [Pikeienuella sp.]